MKIPAESRSNTGNNLKDADSIVEDLYGKVCHVHSRLENVPCPSLPELEDFAKRSEWGYYGEISNDNVAFADTLERLHHNWLEEQKENPKLISPVATLLVDFMKDKNAMCITQESDKKNPVSIGKGKIMGSTRDLVVPPEKTVSENFGEINSLKSAAAPAIQQVLFPEFETKSVLPEILPLQNVNAHFVGETTKNGAVSMPVRLFFEALMALPPSIPQGELKFELGDLFKLLNPDGKYNRTNFLPYVIRGLQALPFLRIPYRQNPDKPSTEGEWLPVMPRAIPTLKSGNNFAIILEVRLPVCSNSGGMLIEKDILRLAAKKSSAKFNAYLSACYVFDTYGTRKGGIISPTKPVEYRNADGFLTDREGNTLYDNRGKPIKNQYHRKNLDLGERERNPTCDQYPILSFDDLTKACFPKGFDKRQKATYRKRALVAWESLENAGVLQIEKERNGWRILPSETHVSRYRAVKKYAKNLY